MELIFKDLHKIVHINRVSDFAKALQKNKRGTGLNLCPAHIAAPHEAKPQTMTN
jgi:hypothetical protein